MQKTDVRRDGCTHDREGLGTGGNSNYQTRTQQEMFNKPVTQKRMETLSVYKHHHEQDKTDKKLRVPLIRPMLSKHILAIENRLTG